MRSKISPEQNQSDEISSSLLENKKFKHLENLSINKLLKIYLQEVSNVNDLKEIVEDYGLQYDEESDELKSNAKIKNYIQRIVDLKDILIAEIQVKRRWRKKALSKLSNIKLKELSEVYSMLYFLHNTTDKWLYRIYDDTGLYYPNLLKAL